MKLFLGLCAALLVLAAPARAEERLLTLYSPPIDSEPYVHRSTTVTLKADGIQAPAEPGYVLGFKEQVLVDSKDPDAKPLPVSKMMVHHLLYYTPGRVDQGSGCLGGAFIGGRGEEHPHGQFAALYPPEIRARYGVRNANDAGAAPEWSVTAMVMNHYQKQKRFYVRTKLWYTTDARTQVYPTTVGDCRHLANGMAYDVPGGGKPGSTYVDRSTWTVPFNARILGAGSHHHGGATHQTLVSKTCNRTLLDARAYYGAADHPYNTIRPILHEPGPIANGTFETAQGIPITAGEVLERTAIHDNSTLHVAAMGFWVMNLVRDDTVDALRAAADGSARGHQARQVRPRGAVRLRPRGTAAVHAEREVEGVQRQLGPDRRPVLQARDADRARGSEDHLALRRLRAAQRDRGQRPARLLLQLPRQHERLVLVHADRPRHLPADVPDPPDDDGADAEGRQARAT